ncbi:PorT family protein [Flammeovirga yaeyamensis]|uniref:PorT family protein n=1 Tax=Flammeovirga yaeyamensis TaxID=367791 RepID=A0AAX1N667_9BACT|nr:outer membrane beta-barrel protein [Flammeovirga yaeyamensis]MBB3700734.1 hypothetical protein [Flammeovirga yaeyamensis]NMF37909.1 PorT family protein [Flammeovirga yaeyamensis]QWG01730.1 PorT family protein [Flammeovirga yaeyamensis]
MKKLSLAILLSFISISLFAQNPLKKIPGNFYLDLGLTNWADDSGLPLETQSRSVSISYMYEFTLSSSGKFTFNPGIGYSADNFFFKNGQTLGKNGDQTQIVDTNLLFDNTKKSKMVANYVEIPLEFRFRTHPGKDAFRLAVGAKFGYMFASHTKVKHETNGDTRIAKDKGNLNLNDFRGQFIGRIGYKWINFFCAYGFTETFKDNAVAIPNGTTLDSTPYTIGITFSSF